MKIAVLGDGFIGWGGGIGFLSLVLSSLQEIAPEQELDLSLLLPVEDSAFLRATKNVLRPAKNAVLNVMHGTRPILVRSPRPLARSVVLESLFGNTPSLVPVIGHRSGQSGIASAIAACGSDVVLPVSSPVAVGSSTPWVGYLWDLQHRHYPDLFGRREATERDEHFKTMLESASVAIVASQSVQADIDRFFPGHRCQAIALPFAPMPDRTWFTTPIEDVQTRYNVRGRYFMISNQFWIHKDYPTAFRALSLLTQDEHDVTLVCTGTTYDYRRPRYFEDLMAEIRALGIAERVRCLGFIPKADQMALMRGAVAVVQPTLFEGGPGGGSVWEAVGLGVPALVSDIDVNCEIKDAGVTFFRVGNSDELAARMQEVLRSSSVREPTDVLLARGRGRARQFGQVVLEAAKIAILSKRCGTRQ